MMIRFLFSNNDDVWWWKSQELFINVNHDYVWQADVTLVRSRPSLAASKAARCSDDAEDLSFRWSMSSLTQHCHHDILFINDCHLYDKAEFFLMLSQPLLVVFWWQHYMEFLHEVYSAMNMTMRIEPGLSACVASSLTLIVSRLPSSAALLTFAFFVIVLIIMIRLKRISGLSIHYQVMLSGQRSFLLCRYDIWWHHHYPPPLSNLLRSLYSHLASFLNWSRFYS